MISQLIVLGSIGTIFDHASIVTAVALVVRSIYFFQVFAGQPPAQVGTPSDLGSSLLSVLTVLGTVITVLGLLFSVYLFYRTRLEISVKVENSVDLAINVLDIHRYPLEEEVWKQFRESRVPFKYLMILLAMISVAILISIINLLIIYIKHLPQIFEIIFSDITIILCTILAPISILSYMYSRARFLALGTTSEEASRWVMDRAEMSVYADYNYLLAKARWSLKQMEATVITVRSDNVEGILRPSRFSAGLYIIKATIKPDQDEKGAFIILIEFIPTLKDKFIIGKYINRFLDLMGSNGFSPNNPVADI